VVLTKYLSILLIVFLLFYYPKFTVQPLTKNRHFSQFTAGAETCEPPVEPPDADLYGPRSEGPVLDAVARSIKQLSGGVLLQMPSTIRTNGGVVMVCICGEFGCDFVDLFGEGQDVSFKSKSVGSRCRLKKPYCFACGGMLVGSCTSFKKGKDEEIVKK